MPVANTATLFPALEAISRKGDGCLHVADGTGSRTGQIYYRNGEIYAVHVDGFMPRVGRRLVTGGSIKADVYADLLFAADNDEYAPSIGFLAVQTGCVSQAVLDAVHVEILLSALGAIAQWDGLSTKWRRKSTTENFAVTPRPVAKFENAVAKRAARWNELWDQRAPGMTPEQSFPAVVSDNREVANEELAVLDAATGVRPLDEVAGECGLTRFETGHILSSLIDQGLVVLNSTPASETDSAPAKVPFAYASSDPDATEAPDTNEQADTMDTGTPDTSDQSAEFGDPGANFSADLKTTLRDDPAAIILVDEIRDQDSDEEAPAADHVETHFAPDVVDAVEHVEDSETLNNTSDETSAFASSEDTLPDGMDLGSIPLAQIESEYDPAPVSKTPPLTGLSDSVSDEVIEAVKHPENVTSHEPNLPPGVPMFVDSTALDAPRVEVTEVEGMPGVPLPPLPDFEQSLHHAEPVPAGLYVEDPITHTLDESASYLEALPDNDAHTAEYPLYADGSGVVAPDFAKSDEQVEYPVYEPGTDDSEDATEVEYAEVEAVYDPEAHDEAVAHPDLMVVSLPDTEPVIDSRKDAALKRALDEADAAEGFAQIARDSLNRLQTERATYLSEAERATLTVGRYETFLSDAENDEVALVEEADQIEQESRSLTRAKAEVDETVDVLAGMVADTETTVEATRQALEEAQNAYATATQEHTLAATDHDAAIASARELAAAEEELAARSERVATDVLEARERTEAYVREIDQVRNMADRILEAADTASRLAEGAQERYESAVQTVTAKQERLRHLS